MKLTEPKILSRYRQIAGLLLKHGGTKLLTRRGVEDLADKPGLSCEDVDQDASPDRLADDLEALGPTFVKLGQLLSTRPDLLPQAYCDALSRLQDDVEPVPFEEIVETIEDSLGVKVARAFRHLERRPLASASLAQVHRAELHDGRQVVVKVQRPGIREQVLLDLEAMTRAARFLCRHSDKARRFQLDATIEQFREVLLQELDFEREAANLRHFHESLEDFESIVVPRPVDDFVSTRVLVMERIEGTSVDDLSGVVHTELPGRELATELFRAYLHQILVDGTFHADPHPGNILLTRDRSVALIDLGMVGHFQPDMQTRLIKLLLALSEGRGSQSAELALALSPGYDEEGMPEFRRRIETLVARESQRSLSEMHLGALLMEVRAIAAECGVMVPPELSILAKTLMNLDGIVQSLSPEFDPAAAVRECATELLQRHLWRHTASKGTLISKLLDTRELVWSLPERTNQILTNLAENRMRVQVDALDEERLLSGMEKIANRITAGLVLAALIVGASLLMRVQTSFTILGYPGLAMLFFLLAAGGGVVLLAKIYRASEARSRLP